MSYELSALRSMLKVDPYNLPSECAQQSVLAEEAMALSAAAKSDVRRAKHALEIAEAEESLRIRRNPGTSDVKLTESSISCMINATQCIKDATTALIEAEALALKCDAVSSAFDHRRSMLNNMVDLIKCGHAMDYAGTVLNEQTRQSLMEEVASARKAKA